MAFSFSVNELG